MSENFTKKKYSHILWDFNGTILDDVIIGFDCANALLASKGLAKLKEVNDYKREFCFPIQKYYEKLGFDFNKYSYEDLAVQWVDYYIERWEKAKVHVGVVDMLELFKKNGIPQYVLSATEIDQLCQQLEKLHLNSYFTEILGLSDIYAVSKVSLAKDFAERINPKSAVLIGDTSHDYDVAKAVGFDCILISNGHQMKETLYATGATVIDNVNKLADIIDLS